MPRVIDHADRFAERAEAQPDLRVLRETLLIPSAYAFHQVAPQENRIAAEWNHADSRVEVQAALKPEEVLKAVVRTEPMVAKVHELHAALDDPDLLLKHHGVHHTEDVPIDIVLGIEYGHDLVRARVEADVKTTRLVDWAFGEGLKSNTRAT